MNIKYCHQQEVVDGVRLFGGHTGLCVDTNLILIDKRLSKKYTVITIFHEMIHWYLFKFKLNYINDKYEQLWYKYIVPFYNWENVYMT